MTTIAPALDLTATYDGFAIWYAGEVVESFPTFDGAACGYRAAEQANRMLEALISPAPTTYEALESVVRELRRRMDGDHDADN
jgi:hypothetical protein